MSVACRTIAAIALAVSAGSASAARLSYDLAGIDAASAAPAPDKPAADEAEAPRRLLQYGLLDRLEWAPQDGSDTLALDFSAFIGGPIERAWVSTTADAVLGEGFEYLEFQAFYSRLVSGWDVQAGLRYDAIPKPDRLYLALGAQADLTDALWFGAHAYVSHRGELSARTYAQYNLDLPGALVLQPSFELDFYAEDIPALGIGRGLSFGEAGLRLRYKLAKEKLAPYVGVSWERLFGRTARMAREAGDEVSTRNLVLGLRSEF